MTASTPNSSYSPKRALLASYDHAYAVAVQQRRNTGVPQFVLQSDDPLQPFKVTSISPGRRQTLLTLVA